MRTPNIGKMTSAELTGRNVLRDMPSPNPNREVSVYWLTDFDAMSPMLFYKANLILAFAFVAEASNMHIPFDMLATEARIKKYWGNSKVLNSNATARLRYKGALNHHLLTSASKFYPTLPDSNITPNCPSPSFKTQLRAAERIVAYVIELPRAMNMT